MCPSSEEITVSMRHLVLVTLYESLSGMHGGISFHPAKEIKKINILKKLCTKLALVTRLYKDAGSTKQN
jgi:hypothetical protein